MTPWIKPILTAVLAVGLTSNLAVAQPAPPDAPGAKDGGPDQPPPPAESQTVKGTVLGYNYGPAGDVNGLILTTDGKTVQVNFPPAMAMKVQAAAAVGASVTVSGHTPPPGPGGPNGGPGGGPDRGGPDGGGPPAVDHVVLELTELTGVDGKPLAMPHPGEKPATTHVDGKVKYLNYARDGRAVGAVLEDGTFVVTGAAGAAELKLAAGQTLSVDGLERVSPGTMKIVSATKVNGQEIKQARRPGPMNGGPGGRGPGGGPGGEPRGPDGGNPPPPPG